MAKKLKVELDVDESEVKKKVKKPLQEAMSVDAPPAKPVEKVVEKVLPTPAPTPAPVIAQPTPTPAPAPTPAPVIAQPTPTVAPAPTPAPAIAQPTPTPAPAATNPVSPSVEKAATASERAATASERAATASERAAAKQPTPTPTPTPAPVIAQPTPTPTPAPAPVIAQPTPTPAPAPAATNPVSPSVEKAATASERAATASERAATAADRTARTTTNATKLRLRDTSASGGTNITGGTGVVAPAAEKAASALNKTARNAEQLSNGAKNATSSVANIARAFTSLGVSMALGFTRQFVKKGSVEDTALRIGEEAAKLGAAGSAFGPVGTAVGTGIGTIKGYVESEKEKADQMVAEAKLKTANMETIKSWEQARSETLAFKKTLDDLGSTEMSLQERQKLVAEEIKKREEADKDLARNAFREIGDTDAFNKAMSKRANNAARIDQLKEVQKRLEKEKPDNGVRPSFDAPDALARIGGYFGGSQNSDLRTLVRDNQEQLRTLKSIDSKTTKGNGGSWQ